MKTATAVLAAFLTPAIVAAQSTAPTQPTVTIDDRPLDASLFGLTISLLSQLPIETRTIEGALALMPGVNPENLGAFGRTSGAFNGYFVDGADVSDPNNGTSWITTHLLTLSELQAPQRFNVTRGGFSGIASDALIRGGSVTEWSGLVDVRIAHESLRSDPKSGPFPNDAAPLKYATDIAGQAGGSVAGRPLFVAVQYFGAQTTPVDYAGTLPQQRAIRFLAKPTLVVSKDRSVKAFVHFEHDTTDRFGASSTVPSDATTRLAANKLAWIADYHERSSRTTYEVVYSGIAGSSNFEPYNGSTISEFDVVSGTYQKNSPFFENNDRMRHTLTATLIRGLGETHHITAGGDFERSSAKSENGFPGGQSIDVSFGRPVFLYTFAGALRDDSVTRYAGYVKDEWKPGSNLTIDAGVRIDANRGTNTNLNKTVLSTTPVSPRVTLTWKSGETLFSGHYGWYFESLRTSTFELVDPKISPIYGTIVDAQLRPISNTAIVVPGVHHSVSADVKPPRMQQAIGGIQHSLWGWQLAVNGVWRKYDQFIDDAIVAPASAFTARVVGDPGPDGLAGTRDETTNTVTTYSQVTDRLASQFTIANATGAFQQYAGAEILVHHTSGDRWQLHASYNVGRATGNYDNASPAPGLEYDDPNFDPAKQPLRDGRISNDTLHMAKIFGTYRAPFDLLVSGVFYYTSGRTFTRTVPVTLAQGRVELFIVPRGSERLDDQMRGDIRVEREFHVNGKHRIAAFVEGFNLGNDDTATSVIPRSGLAYRAPQSMVAPRRWVLGGAYRF